MQGWETKQALFLGMPLWAQEVAGIVLPMLLLLIVWSLVWKGLALWHSARRKNPWWFVIFLLVNTLGILEIIYLFGVAKLKLHELFSAHEHRG